MKKHFAAVVLGLLVGAAAMASSDHATAQVKVTVDSYVSIVFEGGSSPLYAITVAKPGKSEADGHNVVVTSNTHGWVSAGVAMNTYADAPTLKVTPKLISGAGLPVEEYQPGINGPIAVTVTALTSIVDKPGVYTGILTVTATNDI
jgi:hypothetical protein